MAKKLSTYQKLTRNKFALSLFVAAFVLIGAVLIFISQAATPATSIEVENGQMSGTSTTPDGTASNTQTVNFATTKNPDPCSVTGLKFCDNFTGAAGAKPDSTKWNVLAFASNWGVECFTTSPENIGLDGNGNLAFTVRKQAGCGSRQYTSGGVDTAGKYNFQYGKVEIRAKVACGGGVWPALWTATGTGPSWPNSGEIDILEVMDGDQYDAQQTLHGPNGTSSGWQINTTNPASVRWCENYHVYGVDWRQGSIKFMLDGAVVHTITPANLKSGWSWPFDSYNQRILLDLQIGSWGGIINDADLPSTMSIDYIRIFT